VRRLGSIFGERLFAESFIMPNYSLKKVELNCA